MLHIDEVFDVLNDCHIWALIFGYILGPFSILLLQIGKANFDLLRSMLFILLNKYSVNVSV